MILSSFDPELQLKDTKSAIKNKFEKLWPVLKGFKFVTTQVSVLKNIEENIKQNMTHFLYTQKQKQLLMKVTLMIMCLNQ